MRSEVVQFGIISNIHIIAAKTKRAITLCWVAVRASIPKKDVGTAHRKTVTISTIGSRTKSLTLNLFFDISCINWLLG